MNGDLEKIIKKGEDKKEIGIEKLKKEASTLEEKIYTTRKNAIEEIIKKIKEGHDVKEIMKGLEKEDKEKIRGSAKKIIEEKFKKEGEKKVENVEKKVEELAKEKKEEKEKKTKESKLKRIGIILLSLIPMGILGWVKFCNWLAEKIMDSLENIVGSFK